jgi:hypothetical protein
LPNLQAKLTKLHGSLQGLQVQRTNHLIVAHAAIQIEELRLIAYPNRVIRPSQTCVLTLTRQEFEAPNRAIMLESNKVTKFQGFGRSSTLFLKQSDDDKYAPLIAGRPQQIGLQNRKMAILFVIVGYPTRPSY